MSVNDTPAPDEPAPEPILQPADWPDRAIDPIGMMRARNAFYADVMKDLSGTLAHLADLLVVDRYQFAHDADIAAAVGRLAQDLVLVGGGFLLGAQETELRASIDEAAVALTACLDDDLDEV